MSFRSKSVTVTLGGLEQVLVNKNLVDYLISVQSNSIKSGISSAYRTNFDKQINYDYQARTNLLALSCTLSVYIETLKFRILRTVPGLERM